MPSFEALAAFAVASFLIVLIPGPSVLFVVGRSLSFGRRGGVLSVLGNELGAVPLVAAVALGLGAVVAQSVALFTIVKMLGAAYLIYLGISAIRHRRGGIEPAGSTSGYEVPATTLLRQGFVVGLTNPKTAVFFVAALPQFVDFDAGSIQAQMFVLGLLFTLVAFVFDSVWALLASGAAAWFGSSPRRLTALRASGGWMMIGLGGSLALSGSKS